MCSSSWVHQLHSTVGITARQLSHILLVGTRGYWSDDGASSTPHVLSSGRIQEHRSTTTAYQLQHLASVQLAHRGTCTEVLLFIALCGNGMRAVDSGGTRKRTCWWVITCRHYYLHYPLTQTTVLLLILYKTSISRYLPVSQLVNVR